MSKAALFPDAHAEGIDHRVAEHWDLDWPLPVPRRGSPYCPVCKGRLVLKDWRFHKRRTGGANPFRCDVRLKCISCSYVPIFGVPVPRPVYEAATDGQMRPGWIGWREGKQKLAEAGYFDN